MPMVRESMTTGFSLPIAVNEPTGVGCLGLPMDAGMVFTTWPSMLTVKVCPLILATPRVAVAVSNDCLTPPTDTMMDECAGQYVLGVNCILLSASHANVPAGAFVIFGDENSMVR